MDSSYTKLASINVNDKLEKKNGLSYLSWAWALDQLMRADADANWEYGEPKMYGQTMMVFCTVTAFGKKRTAHLPVMDHRNKPIPNPDAFQVNTAMQRCLVKAIALHGLGLYIYAGEDLPEGEEPEKKNGIGAGPRHSAGEEKQRAWNDMPADEQEFLRTILADLRALLDENRADDAYGFLRAKRLDVEEQLAIQYLIGAELPKDKAKELAEAGKRYQVSQMAGERQARKAAETDRKAA